MPISLDGFVEKASLEMTKVAVAAKVQKFILKELNEKKNKLTAGLKLMIANNEKEEEIQKHKSDMTTVDLQIIEARDLSVRFGKECGTVWIQMHTAASFVEERIIQHPREPIQVSAVHQVASAQAIYRILGNASLVFAPTGENENLIRGMLKGLHLKMLGAFFCQDYFILSDFF